MTLLATALQPGEETPIGAGASGLWAKPEDPTLPDGSAEPDGATTGVKAPGICGIVGAVVCPATAKGVSRSIQIASILCSTARRAGTVDNCGRGEGVVRTAFGSGGCGEFCLKDFLTK